MEITVLTEKYGSRRGLLAEHGLSVLVEEGGKRILFDTGQSGVYIHTHNRTARVSAWRAWTPSVLSHGHNMIIREALPNFRGQQPGLSEAEEVWRINNGVGQGDGKGTAASAPWRRDAQGAGTAAFDITWERGDFPRYLSLGQISTTVPSEMEKAPSGIRRTADICRIPWKMSSFL